MGITYAEHNISEHNISEHNISEHNISEHNISEHNISEAKQYGKPVYVYMRGKFHPSNKILGEEPISKEFMEIQYQTMIQQDVENVIMWRKYNTSKNNVKNENWYQVLKENEYLGK